MTGPLLEVCDLTVEFTQRRSKVRAVDHVSFDIDAGEVLGLVGESGSGKSTIGRAVLGLTSVTEGTIGFGGHEITALRGRSRRALGADIQAVFQDPLSSLDPRWTIERSLGEPLRRHGQLTRNELATEVARLLDMVGLPANAAGRVPRQLSGGQRQRVSIARALALSPRLIICDEPTSALDLSTQAQTLNLLRRVHRDTNVSYLFISHDLDVVRYISDRIAVLYRGQIMEIGPAVDIADGPLHPYTRMLVSASPVPDPVAQALRREARASTSKNVVVDATAPVDRNVAAQVGSGCPFASRCAFVADVCHAKRPLLIERDGRSIACHIFDPQSAHPQSAHPEQALGASA